MKLKINKEDINKLVNFSSGLNNVDTFNLEYFWFKGFKVFDLDVDKLNTIPVDLKQISNVVRKEVVNTTKFNKLNVKLNNLKTKRRAFYNSDK